MISERDDVQKFFGKKDEKTPIIGSNENMDLIPIIDIEKYIEL